MRPGEIQSQSGTRLRACWRLYGDSGDRTLRHRRYRRRVAAAGARGDDGRDYRGDAHRGKTSSANREDADPQRDLLRAADWLDWIDGEAGARRGIQSEDRK